MMARRLLTVVALVLALGGCAAMGGHRDHGAAALRDTLLALETKSWQDTKNGDVAAMNDYLADGAILIFADGTRYTKAEFLKALPDMRIDSVAIAPGATVVPAHHHVATLHYKVTYRSAMKRQRMTRTTVWATSTYVEQDRKWKSLLYQETAAK